MQVVVQHDPRRADLLPRLLADLPGAQVVADPDPTRCKWDGRASTTPGTPSKSAADFARAATAGSQSGFDIVSAPVIRQENGPCAVRL